MAISYRRECYSKWMPQRNESSSSEGSEEEEEEEGQKTVMQSLSSIYSLLVLVSKVNTDRILEIRRARRKLDNDWESEEEDHNTPFECITSKSNTCSCIKVYISPKSGVGAKTVNSERSTTERKAMQQGPEAKETLDRARKSLALNAMRRPIKIKSKD